MHAAELSCDPSRYRAYGYLQSDPLAFRFYLPCFVLPQLFLRYRPIYLQIHLLSQMSAPGRRSR